jgi:hypothetical protein
LRDFRLFNLKNTRSLRITKLLDKLSVEKVVSFKDKKNSLISKEIQTLMDPTKKSRRRKNEEKKERENKNREEVQLL